MNTYIYEQPVGHQGERLFNTAPAYTSIPFQEHRGRYLETPESGDEVDPYDAIYGELDLQGVYGQQLAIWTHKNPDTVALFTPIPGDSFTNIVTFARTVLEFNTAVDKMMVLLPGHKRPLDMESVFIIKPGTAIVITPLYDYMVTLHVKQLGHKIDMVVNIIMTVLELKIRLQTERGYPVERMDLLYKDRPLENNRYLFEYRIVHSSALYVLLTLNNELLVHVDTFWGKQYHLYVDACTTGFAIIASILQRTVSQNVVDVVRLYELFLPKHTLVLLRGSRVLDWDNCLGFYNIEDGNVLRMSTIGLAHDMALQKVPVILDTGRHQHITASKFDRWSTVVLKLHGMTGYPVNLMRLVRHKNHVLDFSDTIGSIPKGADAAAAVSLDVSAIKADDDLLYGIPLKFKIARGITELLKVAPSRTIKSVKETLERIGVPNASIYDLLVDGYRLPNNKRVVDVIEEYKVPIEVSLRQYPVFIHGTQNIIYKMLAHSKETLATFLMRVKMKTGLSYKDYLLMICGNVLDEDDSLPVFDTRITVKSSIFLIARKQYRSFFILHDDWMSKVRVPAYPGLEQIKDILWKERHVPEGGLASIGNFLQWYFAPRQHRKSVDAPTPLKERMLVYEANIGKKYLQMQIESPRAKKKMKPKGRKSTGVGVEEPEFTATNAEKKHRTFSLPTYQSSGKHDLYRPADRHQRLFQRKAFTTLPALKAAKPHRTRRKKVGVAMPLRKYKHTDSYGRRGGHRGYDDDDDEWVFCLTHDYTLPVKVGRRRTAYH